MFNVLEYKFDVTVLCTSKFNYLTYASSLINENCEIFSKNNLLPISLSDISDELYATFDALYLKKVSELTFVDNLKLNILSRLSSSASTFIFCNVLTYLDNTFKTKLITYLKTHEKQIINFTMDTEETLYLDYLVVYHDKLIMEGATTLILQEENILKKLGFKLPFIVELSQNLKSYNLIDKIYFDKESLVESLWK